MYPGFSQECSKEALRGDNPDDKLRALSVAVAVMDTALRLTSPFLPFLSEELYQRLPIPDKSESVIIAPYPTEEEVRND